MTDQNIPGSKIFHVIFRMPKKETIKKVSLITLLLLIVGWTTWIFVANITFKQSLKIAFTTQYTSKIVLPNLVLDLNIIDYHLPFVPSKLTGIWKLGDGQTGEIDFALIQNHQESVSLQNDDYIKKILFKRISSGGRSTGVDKVFTFSYDDIVEIKIENSAGEQHLANSWVLKNYRGAIHSAPTPSTSKIGGRW